MRSLMLPEEREYLAACVAMAPRDGWIVELGTYEGASAEILCRVGGDDRVVTLDNYTSHVEGEDHSSPREVKRALCQLGYTPYVLVRQTDDIPEFIDRVALLFVDSRHDAETLAKEMTAWEPILDPRAIVVLHDYDRPIHADLADEIDRRFRDGWQQLRLVKTLVAFRRVAR